MRSADNRTKAQLLDEIMQLSSRLDEAEQTLQAIRSGEVDALVVVGPQGERVFSLTGADRIYRVIAETMHEAALTVDLNGTILFCNQRFSELMKTPINEALGRKVRDFVSRPQERPLEKLLSDVQAGPAQRHLTLRASDGTVVPVQLSASLIEEDSGASICLLASDLTELEASAKSIRVLRENQQALEESQERLRAIFESTEEAIITLDDEQRCLDANPAAGVITGVPHARLVGRCLGEFIDSNYDLSTAWEGFLKTGRFHGEVRILHTSGEERILEASGVAHISPGRHLFVGHDITEHKRSEEAMRRSETLLRTVTDNCADAIFMKDRESRILMANPATCAVIGKPVEQIIGRTDEEAYSNPAVGRAIMENDRRVMESGKTEVVEEVAPGPSGPRVLLSTKTPYRDAEGRIIGVVGVARDITERKRAEEELSRSRNELELRVQERTEELSRARDELEARVEERTAQLKLQTGQLEAANKELESFSYSVSHDLRSPLRAITGFTRMVKEDLGDRLEGDTKRKFEVIQQNVEKMGQLIDDLLAFSRLGRTTMKRSVIDMKGLTEAVIEELKTVSAEKTTGIAVHDLPVGFGDPVLIRQVLINLIGNAVKFTKREEKPHIEITGRRKGDENIYCVKDNGIGFDMKYRDKLFGVFQRLVSESKFEGTGVGLAIVHRIITRHGGRVWAEGKVNAGASFYFTLPRRNR